MVNESDFADFLRLIRAGNDQAAEELVRRYEPLVLRELRLMFRDPTLTRVLDSGDVCQSVWASFFARASAGQFHLERPEQLLGLLIKMARNKFAMAARRHRAARRDRLRVGDKGVDELDPPSHRPPPERIIAAKELLDRLRERLNADERALAELRGQSETWAAIADRMGGTADGRRMQLTRALNRVSPELGIDGGSL